MMLFLFVCLCELETGREKFRLSRSRWGRCCVKFLMRTAIYNAMCTRVQPFSWGLAGRSQVVLLQVGSVLREDM
jgi:hypothetical protein